MCVCVCVCECECVCVRVYALRIVSRDKILRFRNTFIILLLLLLLSVKKRTLLNRVLTAQLIERPTG